MTPAVDRLAEDETTRRRRSRSLPIVEAPAGAGKTELLTQRHLRWLAIVEHPERCCALTFTNKAATGNARPHPRQPGTGGSGRRRREQPHKRLTIELANRVLAHDAALGLAACSATPGRLRITTIDALCASLARQMPYLSRFRQPAGRHRGCCGALSRRHGRGRWKWSKPRRRTPDVVAEALAFMNNDARRLEKLLVAMLWRRDQWLHHAPSRIERAGR